MPGPDTRQLDPESLSDHVGRLYRAAYALCGSTQDAEDLVQDTFERVLRRPRFLRKRDQDLAYLLTVMRNTWISAGRARTAPTVALEPDELA
ncbi:MAG: RNA polymerase sigma factor, partial [Solirubrobacterales bacterium]|nr:RNA polymerase sigma factor [Solirubrobacterales bacterium]